MSDFRSKGPDLLVDLTEHVAASLIELVLMNEDAARHVAQEVADRMAAHWGGQNVYFPMGLAGKLSRRDRLIFDEFNGTNQSDLARKWGVSLQWIYKIVKAVRKDEIARRQRDMFAPPVDD
ncbi:Mor transcription activator family protein [Pseudomonas prosekii]|uniref:Mor transcription activator family protein n=1 Tax=Pseudomonas prosekii TaxID=1148509 RepID=UPI00387B9581